VRAVEILLPAGCVEPGGLELRRRTRRDRDVLPRRRDRERLDPSELLLVSDPLAAAVVITERALPALPAPPHVVVFNAVTIERDARRGDHRRPRGRRDRAGAAGGEPPRARVRRDRCRTRIPALRPLARTAPRDRERGRAP